MGSPDGRRRTRRARLRGGLAALGVLGATLVVSPPAPAPAQVPVGPAEVDADLHTLRTPPLGDGQFEIITLSTMPDTVSGGDVLVAVRGLDPGAPLTVTRDGTDVTAAFATLADGERRGLVTGLTEGENTLVAVSGGQRATLVVRDHPVTGPIISGPHQEPFACRTEDAGLGAPLDEDCSIAPTYQWFYRSTTDQGFHELADPSAPYPDDVMATETSSGEAVPFVARVETRTINRGITRIAVLDDPAGRDDPMAFAGGSFDGRVYHAFGESCGVGHQQGVNDPMMVLGAVDLTQVSADRLLINLTGIDQMLGRGHATVHSTLTSFGVHCNPFISIETAMMVKEHISEQYGLVEAVIGTNGSGAALQQYNAINNAPGLLAAGMPTATFTDIPSTAMTVADCGLLQGYYDATTLSWTDTQKAAVNGHNLLSGNQLNAICQSWKDAFFSRLDPTASCVPAEQRYDPATNPDGVRCTLQDSNVNLFGIDPATGFARRPLDNVGVQYGLAALQAGTITPEQFVDLNTRIGGLDIDGQPQPERHAMDPEVAAILYESGTIVGRGALGETPVIDLGPYLDLIPVANIHESVRPFQVRARLREHTGQDDTQVIWRGVVTQADALDEAEEWVTATAAARPDPGGDHVAAVAGARPASVYDRCAFGTIGGRLDTAAINGPLGLVQGPLLPGADLPDLGLPLRVDVPEDFDSGLGPCSLVLPVVSTPRAVAGMPLTDDIVKCRLQPIDPADYPPSMTQDQLDALAAAFPDGVCDYDQPGVGEVERSMIWPSLGGEVLQPPTPLTWRVGRSQPTGEEPPPEEPPASVPQPPASVPGPPPSTPATPDPVGAGGDGSAAPSTPGSGRGTGSRDGVLARTGLDSLDVLVPAALLVFGLGIALHTFSQPTGPRERRR
ncbi:hypothetical protein HC251_03565 [Iamia sp. SCSIO 61187]|uniref:DUF6351 family protein n=1 Tax=Iamia sp. SCSIO 61187 TaxID=2722752 RepID=UPI001C636CC8|nr:DUF6351 family protein [Iamia sp. SCSIO 61187]QYG91607.1 hypothetical protein HC251_03565 [Iamia sp. SCSIO 61187]